MARVQLGVTARDGLLAAGLGLLAAASFPPLDLWLLSLVAIALFLRMIRDRTSLGACSLGLLYGLVYGLGTMHWFSRLVGPLAVLLIALFAAYFGLLAALVALTRGHRLWIRALEVAVFAVAVEWLRGDAWYLRFPWYTVPHALAAAPAWIAPARWIGTEGLSFVAWLIAGLGAFGQSWAWLTFLLLPLSSFLLPDFDPPDRRALLVQTEKGDCGISVIRQVPAEPVDLAVMPEYSCHVSPKDAVAVKGGPGTLARSVSSPVVFGAVEGAYRQPGFRNVAVLIDSQGQVVGTFTKQRPLPLFNDGSAGTERPVFPLEHCTLGMAICYDLDAPGVAASLVRGGATVLVVPTLDHMGWTRIQHVHHERLLRLRAVENDRWILRAASSGRSEAIDPHGQPSERGLEIGEVGYIVVDYGHRSGVPSGSWAALLGPVMAAASVLLLGWQGFATWRLRRKEERIFAFSSG